MKAIVYTRYGSPDVLQLHDVPKPAPKDNEVLIKVHATTATAAECLMRKGEPLWGRVILGLFRPRRRMRTLGLEVAGEIESVGKDVRRFQPGDQVFGFAGFNPGMLAEYKCLPAGASLGHKPANVSHAEAAAAVDGATTALFFLRDKAKVQAGRHVLVNGASGSIGTYAVQLAKLLGAEVTGVCGPRNVDLVKSLGADTVIDYTRDDFTTHTGRYDVVFDTVTKSSFAKSKNALTERGQYIPTTGLGNFFRAMGTSVRRKKVTAGMSVNKNAGLVYIKELIEADKLRIVVDRTYRLDQAAEAYHYVETGHKSGNVVIAVADA